MQKLNQILAAVAMVAIVCLGVDAGATALSAARYTVSKNLGPAKRYLMKASDTIYKGGLVMINSSGTAEPATASASNNGVVGVATQTVTAAASGDYYITAAEGWFKFAGTTLGQDDVGSIVYAEDDQTVDETAGSNEPVAGLVIEYISASEAWIHVSPIYQARTAISDPISITGDITIAGGAGGITMTDSASSMVVPDNDSTALLIGSTGQLNLITLDTTDDNEEVNIVGTTTVSAFRVDTGTSTFDEDATFSGGAGAITLSDSASSIVLPDADASALDIGASGTTNMMRFDTTDDAENVTITTGLKIATKAVTGVTTLDAADCGKTLMITAAADGDAITLPATIAGCSYTFMYTGADGGALVDISPNASDAIHGSCTVAAAVDEASGADDADFGLTKATANTGDTVTMMGDGTEGWYITACAGIWTNN